MGQRVELEGWEELFDNLAKLSARAQKNVLRGMVRAEAGNLAQAMKQKAPILKAGTLNPHGRYPGELRDAITSVSINPSATPGYVAAGVRIRGSSEGLKSTMRAVRALGKGAKGIAKAARELGATIADGYYWRWIEYGSPHNDPPEPFARQTWAEQKSGSVQRCADYVRVRLEKLTHD